jgi:hypothetical protein
MLGASWGSSQMTQYITYTDALRVPNLIWPRSKITLASYFHDWNGANNEFSGRRGSRYNMPRSNNMHRQWVYDSWFSDSSEPGITGQALRIIGTPVFLFFSIFDGDVVNPADLQSPAEQTYIWGL